MIIIRLFFYSIIAFTLTFILCVMPVPEVPQLDGVPLMDKWVHFVMFGGIAFAVWIDVWRSARRRRRHGIWTPFEASQVRGIYFFYAVGIPLLFGGVTELTQGYLTTWRSGEWLDFLADSIGVILAIPFGIFLVRPLILRCRKNKE